MGDCQYVSSCTALATIARERQVPSAAPETCRRCPLLSVPEAFADAVAAGDTPMAEYWARLAFRQ